MNQNQILKVLQDLASTHAVKKEIEWQEQHWSHKGKDKTTFDERVTRVKEHSEKALAALQAGDKETANEEFRVLAAIVVATMVSHVIPERK